GGILTPYGRQLSREILSTWGVDGEEAFAYGIVHPPDWLNFGGDVRTLNLWNRGTPQNTSQFILMQADLETAITYKQFYVDGTFGRLDTAIYPLGSSWISR